jgi:hypothetical protein
VDAARSVEHIQQELRDRIEQLLEVRLPPAPERLPLIVQSR